MPIATAAHRAITSSPKRYLQANAAIPRSIAAEMDKITESREATQPMKSRTGGSTFKNPPGHKAWQLIDAAGCRGLRIGDAQVSEMHCNFLINLGHASAADIETLGETVRRRVKDIPASISNGRSSGSACRRPPLRARGWSPYRSDFVL